MKHRVILTFLLIIITLLFCSCGESNADTTNIHLRELIQEVCQNYGFTNSTVTITRDYNGKYGVTDNVEIEITDFLSLGESGIIDFYNDIYETRNSLTRQEYSYIDYDSIVVKSDNHTYSHELICVKMISKDDSIMSDDSISLYADSILQDGNLYCFTTNDIKQVQVLSGSKKTIQNPFSEYMVKNQIVLDNIDIQYDQLNNREKQFLIKGSISLSDYYNYGYRDVERTHFCIKVTPLGFNNDSWYIYCNRNIFQELLDSLKKENTISAMMICNISEWSEGQSRMATLLNIAFIR